MSQAELFQVQVDQLRSQLTRDFRPGPTRRTPTGVLEVWFPRLHSSGSPALAIKQNPSWTEQSARGLFLTLQACREYASEIGSQPFTPAPHSWGADPPYVCLEWVEGTEMRIAIQALASEGRGTRVASEVAITAKTLGLLLYRYHAAMMLLESSYFLNAEVTGGSVRMTRLLVGASRFESTNVVRSVEDPGLHNVVRKDDGSLILIDLPAHFMEVPIERDVALLASRLVGSAHYYARARWIPRLKYHRAVTHAVIAGYEQGAPLSLRIDRTHVFASMATNAAIRAAARRRKRLLQTFIRECLTTALLVALALRQRLMGK
jgi:hypothetical protein